MNVADLVHLADLAAAMRANGIHRARFADDGTVAECELEPKYVPPPPPDKPPTLHDIAMAKRDAELAAARDAKEHEALLFMASEGYPRP